ncbi:AraC family transcriptional regulator [uncultured Kordia sp.]|uniref:AraC family transcriptional regulator n=1 Tax=uncultured Kordia sp. TaxID=507699 RepID=UPI002629DA9E|nr:AraC family transcriptional regulator [uncultured Kordia sp.]
MNEKVIAKTIFISYLSYATQLKIDTTMLFQNEVDTKDNDFVSFEQFASLLHLIVEKTENQNVGLYFGEQSNIAALGIVGQLIQTSKTIGNGLAQALSSFNLISNVIALRLKKENTRFKLYFEIDESVKEKYPVVCKQLIISSMVFVCKEIYFLTLKKHHPTYVAFEFEIDSISLYERIFHATIVSNKEQNCIEFPSEILDEEIVYADYELFVHLEKLVCKRLSAQVGKSEKITDVVKQVICKLLDPDFPKLNIVANHLHVSERALQRKLKKENTTYSQLLNELKQSMAVEYLASTNSIKEISYLLGYSNPSAFVNAFKSWYKISPSAYREEQIFIN